MIYISFDIGVKNLALCILKKTDKIEVLDWRIIALADSKKELKGIDDISERVYYEMDNIVGFLKEQEIDTIDYVSSSTRNYHADLYQELIQSKPRANGIYMTSRFAGFHMDRCLTLYLVNSATTIKSHS